MRPIRAILIAVLGAGAASWSCAAILGIGEPPEVGVDDSGGAGADGAVEGSITPTPDAGCPRGPGDAAPMVEIDAASGARCIDAYEVTELDYAAFLAVQLGSVDGQGEECQGNTSYKPRYLAPTPRSVPIAWIDWCDAVAYCRWAGKRLCGAVDGGPLPADRISKPDDEWFLACSHNDDGLHPWPYGTAYAPHACNAIDNDAGGVLPVGSKGLCGGGYDGIFDMAGNVTEWIDSCYVDVDGGRRCFRRGGAYFDNATLCRCDSVLSAPADDQNGGVGFRCCASAR